jgi:hypothetical protein
VLSSGKRREVAARDPSDADAAWLLRLQRERRLYVTPRDCHDDWFWLYAAVRAGVRTWASRGAGDGARALAVAGPQTSLARHLGAECTFSQQGAAPHARFGGGKKSSQAL